MFWALNWNAENRWNKTMEFSIFINMHSISITPIRFKSETIFLGACNQWELRALHLMIMKHWLTFCLFPVKQIQIDSQKHYRNNRSFEKSLFFYWISSSLCKETFIQTKNKPTKSIFFFVMFQKINILFHRTDGTLNTIQ